MKAIFKYELTLGRTAVEMPRGATVLSVQMQNGNPCLWAMVDTDVVLTDTREFVCFGTGHKINEEYALHFIGTTQIEAVSLVFHFFEII